MATKTKETKEKTLVIVESPAKSKTIGKILGSNYFIGNGFADVLNYGIWYK